MASSKEVPTSLIQLTNKMNSSILQFGFSVASTTTPSLPNQHMTSLLNEATTLLCTVLFLILNFCALP
ncbi:MAG: hypothetical protein QXK21_01525 [Candidatus Micrarchaeia archaeon]